MGRLSQNLQAIVWISLTGFLIISINTIVRYLYEDYHFHPFQLVFFYSALGLVMYVPFIWRNHFTIQTHRTRLYLMRSVLEFIGFSLVFYGLTLMPMPVHTALSFTSPLFGTAAAILLLKEPNNRHRWLALVVGFAGVLVVARPGITDFGWNAGIVLAAALCFSTCMICIKRLTLSEPSPRIAFYMLAYTALISLPFALYYWKVPLMEHLPLILLMGILVALVQYSVSQAFSKADVTIIAPFFFVNLLWSSLFAYLVFGEVVDTWTLIGGAIILKAALYAMHHAHKTPSRGAVAQADPLGPETPALCEDAEPASAASK